MHLTQVRFIGIIFYVILYCSTAALYFSGSTGWPLVVAAVSAVLFGALGPSRRGGASALMYRPFALAGLICVLLAVVEVFPIAVAIMFLSAGLLWFAAEFATRRTPGARAAAAALALLSCAALPLPGVYTAAPGDARDYSVSGHAGSIQAPSVRERLVLAGEWLVRPKTAASAPASAAVADASGFENIDFGELYQLPFDVPAELYAAEGSDADPHAVMKLLSRWNEYTGEDATQGQVVMGVGAVAPGGELLPVDDIAAYTKAASLAKPKVFFVPLAQYEEARNVDKQLLVVPVSRFEEVLYFLSEPVMFWPLRNFGLFCH